MATELQHPPAGISSSLFCVMTKATPSPVPFTPSRDVVALIRVAQWTVCFGSVASRQCVASQDILSTSDYFHVGRIHAVPNSAEMVEGHEWWNCSHKSLVCPTMSNDCFCVAERELPVSSSYKRALPKPAGGGLFDPGPEAFCDRNCCHDTTLAQGKAVRHRD